MPHETMRQDHAGIWNNEQFLKTCQKTEYKKNGRGRSEAHAPKPSQGIRLAHDSSRLSSIAGIWAVS